MLYVIAYSFQQLQDHDKDNETIQHVPTTTPRTNASVTFNLLRTCASSGAGATLSPTSCNVNHDDRNEGNDNYHATVIIMTIRIITTMITLFVLMVNIVTMVNVIDVVMMVPTLNFNNNDNDNGVRQRKTPTNHS